MANSTLSTLEAQVLDELHRIARDELEHDGALSSEQRLREDLMLDSMAMIVVAVGLENRFRVQLHEEDAGAIRTVGDLVGLVARRVREAEAGR